MDSAEETVTRIRPVWLIGGRAFVVTAGICTLLSVCAAVAMIWLNSQISVRPANAMQVAVQEETEPTATAVRTTPTGLLLQPTPLQVLTLAVSLPTAIVPPTTAPDQAVKAYYQLASQERYDLSWPLLTHTFKQKFNCCAPNYNYTDYVNWWNSVNYVDFGDVHIVSQSSNRAVVYTEMYYVMNTGARSSLVGDPYIELVYDAASGNWRFEDKRGRP